MVVLLVQLDQQHLSVDLLGCCSARTLDIWVALLLAPIVLLCWIILVRGILHVEVVEGIY